MRVLLFVSIAFMACALSAYAGGEARSSYALVVGINRYDDPYIATLAWARADARLFAQTLTTSGGLPADHVLVLTDEAANGMRATRSGILGAVQTFLKPRVKKDDEVIVYLSGHGIAKGAGDSAHSFYLPCDTKGSTLEALKASAVDLKELTQQLSDLGASQYVLIVDACRNDPLTARGAKDNLMSDVMSRDLVIQARRDGKQDTRSVVSVTLSSCKVGERSYEDPKMGHGVFTQYLVDGIREGVPQPPDGVVEVGRLSDYVRAHVADWTRQSQHEFQQTPSLSASEMAGPVVMLKVSAARPAAAPQPGPCGAIIRSWPEGCEVVLDNKAVGVAPLRVPLTAGEHVLKIARRGFKMQVVPIHGIAGYVQSLDVFLAPAGELSANALAQYDAAQQKEARGAIEGAIALYRSALEDDPRLVEAWYRIGVLAARRGRSAEAVDALNKAIALNKKDARYHAALALALLATGETNALRDAKTQADTAMREDDRAAEAQRAHALVLLVEGKTKEAVDALTDAVKDSARDASLHHALGRVLARAGSYEKAAAELQAALDLYPYSYEANRDLGFVDHHLGRKDQALKAYQLASSLRGGASDADELAGVNLAIAGILMEGKQRTAALAWRDEALEMQPDIKKIALALAVSGVARLLPEIPGVGKVPSMAPKGTVDTVSQPTDFADTSFPEGWRKSHLIWDFRKHDLVCHDASAVQIAEERKLLTGHDASGKQVSAEFRMLTYKCEAGKHEIKVWLDVNSGRIRDISCHAHVCADRGFKKTHSGNAIDCTDHHTFYLVGTHP